MGTKENTNIIEDKQEVLKLVAADGNELGRTGLVFCDDEDVVKAAVENCGMALEFASDRLKNNIEIAVIATSNDGMALSFVGKELNDNFEVVMSAVKNNGRALVFAGEKMKDNEEIVLAALRNYPNSFKYASKRIRDIKKFVLMTLDSESKFDFAGIDKKWFSDPIFMFEGVKFNSKLLSKFDRNFLNRDMAKMFVKRDGLTLEYLIEYSDDFDIVKEAVKQNGMSLKFASEKLRDNLEISLTAMAKDIEASCFIGNNVRKFLREIPDRYPSRFN